MFTFSPKKKAMATAVAMSTALALTGCGGASSSSSASSGTSNTNFSKTTAPSTPTTSNLALSLAVTTNVSISSSTEKCGATDAVVFVNDATGKLLSTHTPDTNGNVALSVSPTDYVGVAVPSNGGEDVVSVKASMLPAQSDWNADNTSGVYGTCTSSSSTVQNFTVKATNYSGLSGVAFEDGNGSQVYSSTQFSTQFGVGDTTTVLGLGFNTSTGQLLNQHFLSYGIGYNVGGTAGSTYNISVNKTPTQIAVSIPANTSVVSTNWYNQGQAFPLEQFTQTSGLNNLDTVESGTGQFVSLVRMGSGKNFETEVDYTSNGNPVSFSPDPLTTLTNVAKSSSGLTYNLASTTRTPVYENATRINSNFDGNSHRFSESVYTDTGIGSGSIDFPQIPASLNEPTAWDMAQMGLVTSNASDTAGLEYAIGDGTQSVTPTGRYLMNKYGSAIAVSDALHQPYIALYTVSQ